LTFVRAESRKQYDNGVWWRLHAWRTHGEVDAQGPLPDTYFVNNLKACVARKEFDTPTGEQWAQESVCFFLGMLHGGVLSPKTSLLRPNVTTLIVITDHELARGYDVGRRWFFVDAMPDEDRIYTDEQVMQELCSLVQENREAFFCPDDTLIQYSLGTLLGAVSARLFPATSEESQRWEAEQQHWLTICEQERMTEPLSLNVLQHA